MKKYDIINEKVNVTLRSGLLINGEHIDLNNYNENLEHNEDLNNDIIEILDLKGVSLFYLRDI